jgi:hypothetical protein
MLAAEELLLNTSWSAPPTDTVFAPVAAAFRGVELTESVLSPVMLVKPLPLFICKAAVTVPLDV